MESVDLNGNVYIEYDGLIQIFSDLSHHHIKKLYIQGCTRERVYINHIRANTIDQIPRAILMHENRGQISDDDSGADSDGYKESRADEM